MRANVGSQVGFGLQTLEGTSVAPTKFLKVLSGGLGYQGELNEPEPEIGGSRGISDVRRGNVHYGGDYGFYFRPEDIGLLIYAATGGAITTTQPNATGNPTVYLHAFSMANILPLLTVQQKVGSAYDTWKYTDTKINSLGLELGAGGYFRGSCNCIAKDEAGGETSAAATYEDRQLMAAGPDVTLTWDAATLPASSFGFSLDNGLATDDFRLTSIGLATIDEGRRKVGGTVKVRPQDKNLYRQAAYGATTATTPSGVVYKGAMVFKIQSADIITVGQPEKYFIEITFPKAVIGPFPVGFSGDSPIEHDLQLMALAGTVAECTIKLQNKTVSYTA